MRDEIKENLFLLQDKKYKNFHSKLCPGVTNIIGVRLPILRKYAKELLKKYNKYDLLNEIDSEYYEEIMLQGIIIGTIKDDLKKSKEYIEKFIPKINNWAICDTFCASLKITKKYKMEMWNFIQKYLDSEKDFEIRFGIVMILDYYIDEDNIQNVYKVFNSITSDGYYVQMALAWAISVCLVKFYDKTIKYLEFASLDKFTYNKALQKAIESYRITDSQKNILRSMKK